MNSRCLPSWRLEVTWVYGVLMVAGAVAGLEVRAFWVTLVFAVSWGLATKLRGLRVRWWVALVLKLAGLGGRDPGRHQGAAVPRVRLGRSRGASRLFRRRSALVARRRLAGVRPGFATVVGEFQFGLMVLATVFCLAYLLGREPAGAIAVGVIYVTLGLVGAAVAQSGEGGEGRLTPVRQGSWWGMLLVSVTVILMLGLLGASSPRTSSI